MKSKIIKSNLIIILISILFLFSSCKTAYSISPHDCLLVHFIDVGQGDSILIQSNNKNILIDSGLPEKRNKLKSYLKKMNTKNFEYVFATHPHDDHIGGMPTVINNFKIKHFYAPKVVTNTPSFFSMVKALKKKNLKIIPAKAYRKIIINNNFFIEILAPNSDKYEDMNDYSIVLKLTYYNTKFLFTGDAQALSENEILSENIDLSCDVLKVGHHGSKTSSSMNFLRKVNPHIAVISCGAGNNYGHPHIETLNKLESLNCKIYRTDLNGNIIIKSDGNKLSLNTQT